MAGNSAGRIDLDLGLNFGEFQRQLGGIAGTATNMVGGAFKKLGGVIAGAFAVGGLVSFANGAIDLASDLQEVQNVVDVTFGAMSGDINNFAKEALTQFGLSELSAKKYASTMGAMLKSSGIAGGAVRDMSLDMAKLTADMASFYNLSTDMAFHKIRAGISGETEPLKELGVNMSVANMEAYALSQGITKSYQAMNQAEQTLLRYNYLLSVTGDAQGDFIRNGDSWANQIRVMSEQWNIFKGTMGAGFINVLTPVIKWLNFLISKLQVAAAYFKAFTELIFGDAVGGSAAAAGVIGGMGAAATDAAGAVDEAGSAASGAGKAAKKAGKDIKGGLGGFDQLNTLAKSAAGSLDDAAAGAAGLGGIGDVGGGASMGDIDFGTPDIDVDPIKQKVAGLIAGIKADFTTVWGHINTGWAKMAPALQPLTNAMKPIKQSIHTIGKTFVDLKDTVLMPFASYALTNFIPSITTGFLTSFVPVFANQLVWSFNEFERAFTQVTSEATRLWTTVWLPNLELVKQAFLIAMPQIAASLQSLLDNTLNPLASSMISFGINVASALSETLLPLFTDTLVWSINLFATTFDNAVQTINGLWTGTLQPAMAILGETFLTMIPQIGTVIQSLLDNTIKPFVDYALNQFIIPIAAAIVETLVPVFADSLVVAINAFATTFEWAVNLINDLYNTVMQPVFELIKTIVLDTLTIITELWEEYGGTLLTNVTEMMEGLRGLFQQLWDDILKPIIEPFLVMLSGLWDEHLKGLVKQVGEFVLKVVTGVQEIINKAIIPLISWVADKLGPSFVKSFNVISNIVGTVIGAIAGVLKGLIKSLGGVIDFVVGVFTGNWRKAWTGVKDIFKGVFDSLVAIVKLPLNLIIDSINAVIAGLNSISIDVPDWVPGLGGKSIGVTIPKIPKLAKGGLAYGPTLAMVGDNKGASADPEVISPLSKLQDLMSGSNGELVMVLTQILEAIRSQDTTSVLKIGETEFGRVAAKAINSAQRQSRQPLIST